MGELEDLSKNLSDAARQMQESSEITAKTTRKILAANECLLEVYRHHLMAEGPDYVAEHVRKLSADVQDGRLEKRKLLAVAMSVGGLEKSVAEEEIARLVIIGEPAFVLSNKKSIAGSLYCLAVCLNEIEAVIGPGGLLPKVQHMARNLESGATDAIIRDLVSFSFEFFRSKAFFESDSDKLRAAYTNAGHALKGLIYVLKPSNFERYFLEF